MKHKILGYIFLGIIFAAAVGATYYWKYGKIDNNNSSNIEKNQTQNNVSLYVIPELGLKFWLSSSLSDLKHQVVKLSDDQAVNSVMFSTQRLLNEGCYPSSLGYLTYDNDKGGIVVAQARGSNLYYIKPSKNCGGESTIQQQQKLQEALKFLVVEDDVSSWKTYRNKVFSYEFSYPSNADFQENEADATQAQVYFDKAFIPQTDFGHAEFQVSINPSIKTEIDCTAITYSNPISGEKPAGKKTINGILFIEGGSSGAAAGTYVQEKVYRVFRNGICYDLTERLFTKNIQVYDNWQELGLRYMTESEKQLIWNKLDKILSTFKFIDI